MTVASFVQWPTTTRWWPYCGEFAQLRISDTQWSAIQPKISINAPDTDTNHAQKPAQLSPPSDHAYTQIGLTHTCTHNIVLACHTRNTYRHIHHSHVRTCVRAHTHTCIHTYTHPKRIPPHTHTQHRTHNIAHTCTYTIAKAHSCVHTYRHNYGQACMQRRAHWCTRSASVLYTATQAGISRRGLAG